ncbi:MAG: hypothetical protein ABSF69_17980 [Polyangiaceae bacterium]
MLVSESVERRARQAFAFRLVDVVAVKGKTKAVGVYELLGVSSEDLRDRERMRTYEAAHAAYVRRDFAAALTLLQACEGDGPAEVLAARCRRYLAEPPPQDWDGSFRAEQK